MIQQKLNFYRLHFINPETRQIGHTYDFHAEDDARAIRFAGVWTEDAPMVLMGRNGFIRRWGLSGGETEG